MFMVPEIKKSSAAALEQYLRVVLCSFFEAWDGLYCTGWLICCVSCHYQSRHRGRYRTTIPAKYVAQAAPTPYRLLSVMA
jgi:hypothetical protein